MTKLHGTGLVRKLMFKIHGHQLDQTNGGKICTFFNSCKMYLTAIRFTACEHLKVVTHSDMVHYAAREPPKSSDILTSLPFLTM